MFPKAEVRVLEVATSDHLPLSLQLQRKVFVPKCKRFRIENVWLKEKDCLNVVENSWAYTEGKDLVEKINYCCLKLDEWGGGKSQEFKRKLADCRDKLKKLRSRRDVAGIHMYNNARWEFLNLLEKKEVYWRQRAKVFWLQNGDKNTRFFHQFASARRKNNGFQRIKNTAGEWVETEEDIQHTITDYFDQLSNSCCPNGRLSERENVNQITEMENVELEAEISYEEVKEAVFSMYPEKSPGLDGLNPAFYRSYWSIVGRDVVKFCQHYMSTGELLGGINQTVVCLIPKVKVPKQMNDLRPISLCNVLVRILSKVLANRLKPCLKQLISDKQSAFIEGRLLNDNALIAFEVNYHMRRQTQGSTSIAGFKLDISKAHDRLEWDFVQNMMIKFGFSQRWIARTMGLITSVSYRFVRCLGRYNQIEECAREIRYLPIFILCVQKV